ncbi:hypothetical protein ACGFJ7_43890 [Actinoplanes sp. NPDC048988]|uniref:hypothetical protein n=1 Tax=Actinoplanes sp. NPDC048988 TaxID=3363901 RepID=UPI00371991F8
MRLHVFADLDRPTILRQNAAMQFTEQFAGTAAQTIPVLAFAASLELGSHRRVMKSFLDQVSAPDLDEKRLRSIAGKLLASQILTLLYVIIMVTSILSELACIDVLTKRDDTIVGLKFVVTSMGLSFALLILIPLISLIIDQSVWQASSMRSFLRLRRAANARVSSGEPKPATSSDSSDAIGGEAAS